MATVVDVMNPIEVREAGTRVLRETLGSDVAQAFIYQCEGDGDFTRERREQPELPFDELTNLINAASAEIAKRQMA